MQFVGILKGLIIRLEWKCLNRVVSDTPTPSSINETDQTANIVSQNILLEKSSLRYVATDDIFLK